MVGLVLGAAGLTTAGILVATQGPGGVADGGAAPSLSGADPAAVYNPVLSASEFVVGTNRFPFALISNENRPLEGAQVAVRFFRPNPGEESVAPWATAFDLRSEATAKFVYMRGTSSHRHPDTDADHEHVELTSVYLAQNVEFDSVGTWKAEFDAITGEGAVEVRGVFFDVRAEPGAIGVGEAVPPSRNLTVADVDDIAMIDTRVPPDDMHEISVAQALARGKPFVVAFSTPLFCVTRICGPVTDIVAQLQAFYGDQVNFLHVEPWDLARARDEGRLVPGQAMLEWRLSTEHGFS